MVCSSREAKGSETARFSGHAHSPALEIEIVDRVGSGDSFTAGFLYGYLTDNPQTGVNYGVGVSALKQTNPGDLCWATREETERLLEGGGLRIVR